MAVVHSTQFYADHGEWSDPRSHAGSFESVGKTVPAITSTVQGLFMHDYFGAYLYQELPANFASAPRATLPIRDRLPTLHAFDATPLSKSRDTTLRTVGTCRDFALLTCSMLRHHGIPARVRCGFASYLCPPNYEDHWICEYWDKELGAWKKADAQLDRAHIEHLSIAFDTNDMPDGLFLYPWQVWNSCRGDLTRLEVFGQGKAKGFWFVRVNLARDFLALMKHEVSNWDTWRDHAEDDRQISDEAVAQCDQLADAAKRLSTAVNVDILSFDELMESLGTPHWQA